MSKFYDTYNELCSALTNYEGYGDETEKDNALPILESSVKMIEHITEGDKQLPDDIAELIYNFGVKLQTLVYNA